jgi:hypothetical protein
MDNSTDNNFDPEYLLSVLQRIASGYEPTSEEHLSIEVVAKAILFLHASGQGAEFQVYIEAFGLDLTSEQKRFLASIGLAS